MSLNINRDVQDVFYRYKMPKLIAKVEGKGNGIKTVIANMTEIAKALNRPPSYPTKYFGCEIGAQTQMDAKADRYIVNGEHDAAKLQGLLDGFIKKFVLCSGCDNPETTLTIRKNVIHQACKACGHASTIDPRQKLTTYILKNPPDQEVAENPSVTSGKRGKKDLKKKAETSGGTSPTEENGNGEQNGGEGSPDNSDEQEDEDWADSVDPEAVEKRQRELGPKMLGLTINSDLEKSVEERLDIFYSYLKKQKNKFDAKAVLAEAERLDVKDKATLIMCRVLFDDNILSEIKLHRNIFTRFTHENQRAQKYLLGGIEQLIEAHKKILLPKVAHILKVFYDEELLEEEVLLEWASKPSKKYVSKEDNKAILAKAEPFIKWLKEAEEESEEDEEDDLEVVYEDKDLSRKMINGSSKPGISNGEAKLVEEDVGDEVNIDDI